MNQLQESILCLSFILCSGIFVFIKFRREKYSHALIIILILTLFLKCYCAADQYLHEWDERFHALVAKHLIDHPLKPTLYEISVENYDHQNWVANHIWLSKPPLPLWFMAASIHAFGTHEFAVRLPAIIFSVLSVFLTFKIASNVFSPKAGVIAAALHGTHGMLTDLASGRLSSDGVETCFLFFVGLGMFQIFRKRPGHFTLLDYVITGLLMGLAIMSKWQPGLIVLVILFVYHFDKTKWVRHFMFCSLSLITSLLVVLPWALHCWTHFPAEAKWMAGALFHPMTIQIPGNDGTWYSYLTDFGNFFGYPTYLLCFIAILFAMKQQSRILLTLAIWIMVPLAVFSMAEIKRGTYLMISAPAVFILLAFFLTEKIPQMRYDKLVKALSLVSVLSIAIYSVEKLYLFSSKKSRTKDWSIRLKNMNPAPGSIIYDEPHAIEMMFYHDVTAYPYSKEIAKE